MSQEREEMTIVVDRRGHHGKCSHCNKAASIDTTMHSCGAVAVALAIEERAGVTFTDATLVAAMRSNLEFVGTGRIVSAPSGRLWFQIAKRPGDLP